MVTLNDALIDLVETRQVEPKEAYMRAVDKATFVGMLRQRGHDTGFAEADVVGSAPAAAGGKGDGARAGGRPAMAGR
jgi:twitching motility protein PilT